MNAKETLIYSNQRESIPLALLVLQCFLALPLRGGALFSVSLTVSATEKAKEMKNEEKQRKQENIIIL